MLLTQLLSQVVPLRLLPQIQAVPLPLRSRRSHRVVLSSHQSLGHLELRSQPCLMAVSASSSCQVLLLS